MVSLEWGDRFKSGVDFIDASHQRIFKLIKALEAPTGTAGHPTFKEALAVLLDYTGQHFREEEELMQFTEYPYYEAHKADHEKAVTWIRVLQKEADAGRVDTNAIPQFAAEWITAHLRDYDFHFIKWIRKAHPSSGVAKTLSRNG